MREKVELARDFSWDMKKKNIDAYSAGTSFFLILSLIPLLIMLTSLLPYTAVTQELLIQAITNITPDFTNDILIQLVNEAYEKRISTISISGLVTIWTGGLGMMALTKGLNNVYGVKEHRNIILIRIMAAIYTIAFICIVLLMLMMMVFGNIIKSFIYETLPQIMGTVHFLSHFKFVIVIGTATLLFALIYTYIPNVKLKYIRQLPGAFFSAVIWYLFSWFFAIYVGSINNYSLYGSLATPVIIMFWLYFCIYIFFIGAFINYYIGKCLLK